MITRDDIVRVLVEALEPLDYVHAVWEGGAAAFKRVDEWSDLDVQVVVDDEHVADVFEVTERALSTLSPIDLKYEIPQPAWHGHAQTFYRLRDASEFLLLDLAVMKHSSQDKFLQPEIHGEVVVHFDKSSVVATTPVDQAAQAKKLASRLENLRVTFELFQTLSLKEIYRGNDIEALTFYQGFTLRPLVEVLRIKHRPARHNFYTRYIYYDLPADVVKKLENLFFVTGREDLRAKREVAERWFYQLLEELAEQ